MAIISRKATAGTLESSDAYVEIQPGTQGIQLELDSVVLSQFGATIRQVIEDTLAQLGVENAQIRVVDRGALDCVLRARVEAAVLRSQEVNQ